MTTLATTILDRVFMSVPRQLHGDERAMFAPKELRTL